VYIQKQTRRREGIAGSELRSLVFVRGGTL